MKFTKTSIMLGLAATAALVAVPAIAQNTGWYAGAGVGRTAATIDDDRIRSGLLGQGLGTASISDDDRDTGYKVFGGYQLNRNLALEAGFFNLGHFGYSATTVPAGTLTGDVRVKGINLDLVGTLPITERLSVLGRVGVTSTRASARFASTGAANVPYGNANPHERATNYKAGVGLAYDFTESLAMRVEAERYRINDAARNRGHVDMVSVGLLYRFGAKAPPPRAAAPEPAYVAPAPAPPPAVAYVAPPAPPAAAAAPPAPAPYVEPTRAAKPYRN